MSKEQDRNKIVQNYNFRIEPDADFEFDIIINARAGKEMAWEMQSQFYELVEPSLFYYCEEWGHDRLTYLYVEQRLNEDFTNVGALKAEAELMSYEAMLRAVAEYAIEVATTTNGAHEFYCARMDGQLFHLVPFCSDEQSLAYYA